jgi:alpha-tubulin suppressor-like RCC1 family protein
VPKCFRADLHAAEPNRTCIPGQLGYEDTTDRGRSASEMGDNLPPVNVGAGRTVREVVASSHSTFAIFTSGRAVGWGRNDVGQLGYGHFSAWGDDPNEMGTFLADIDFGSRCVDSACTPLQVLRIAAGGRQMDDNDAGNPGLPDSPTGLGHTGLGHTCALLDDGNGQNGLMKCFGFNSMGQLGIASYSNQGGDAREMGNNLPFVDAGNGTLIQAVSVGDLFTCVALTGSQGGGVKCWGANENGQLGIGSRAPRGGVMGNSIVFTDLGNLSLHGAVQQIVSGASHSCVLLVTGRLKCWGHGGRLGNGHSQDVGDEAGEMGSNLTSVDMEGLVTSVTTRAWHTCVLLETGQVKCFGDNSEGQLGLEDTNSRGDRPGQMGSALHAVALFSSPCEMCPNGATSPAGSVRKSQCVCMPRYVGPAGGPCLPCRERSRHPCVPCPLGFEPQSPYSETCVECAAGKYAESDSSPECQWCSVCKQRTRSKCSPTKNRVWVPFIPTFFVGPCFYSRISPVFCILTLTCQWTCGHRCESVSFFAVWLAMSKETFEGGTRHDP